LDCRAPRNDKMCCPYRHNSGEFLKALFAAFGILLLIFASGLGAQGPSRFPTDRITPEEWQRYFDEVRALPGTEAQEIKQAQYMVVFKDNSAYFFTAPDHPAHPAMVKREAAGTAGQLVFLRQGHYAGDAKAFAVWWEKFEEMDRAAKERIEGTSTGPKR
jgi:hypothetical protein